MTKRLFLLDSHQKTCDATVTSCVQTDGGYAVQLNQTVLFPAAGGQPCDLGQIGGVAVTAVQEVGGDIVHILAKPLPVGETVSVALDWARRFDYMQQHTGEHLLSFLAYDLYGAVNVGFHLADTYTTIDLDRMLSDEALAALVSRTNAVLSENRRVTGALYESEEALAGLPLRKHAEGLTAPIRIVSIEGADCCTCCAPHCSATGEVGSLILTDAAAYKGGMRLTFLCGKRASDYAAWAHATVERMARRFSTARTQTADALDKLMEENVACKKQNRGLIDRLNAYVAEELLSRAIKTRKAKLIVEMLDGFDAQRLKRLAPILAVEDVFCCLFAASGGRLNYLLAAGERVPLDMGELCQAVNAATGGKGGGRGSRAEGMAQSASVSPETLEQLKTYFKARLG